MESGPRWIEVKIGTGLGNGQLESYAKELERVHGLVDAGSMEARGVSIPLAKLSTRDKLVSWWFGVLEVLADAGALELCGGNIDTAEADEDGADEG